MHQLRWELDCKNTISITDKREAYRLGGERTGSMESAGLSYRWGAYQVFDVHQRELHSDFHCAGRLYDWPRRWVVAVEQYPHECFLVRWLAFPITSRSA